MMREAIFALFGLIGVGGLVPLTSPAQAQQFSADMVSTKTSGQPDGHYGKLYVANSKVRIETTDNPDGFFLIDTDAHTAYFVKPAQRLFMDAKQSSGLTPILIPVGTDDPCRQWQAMAAIAGEVDGQGQWRCDEIGRETVAGHATMKYRTISAQNRQSYRWIDPQLGFPTKIQAEDGTTTELTHIRKAPSPAGLFEIPASYRKFDPQLLIDRIKKSDVWVDPPQ